MKIAVVGSREFKDKNFVFDTLNNILKSTFIDQKDKIRKRASTYTFDPITIISGGAKGVDSWGEEFAHCQNCLVKIFYPDWDKYGKRAGFLRNELIINEADKVIAFWDGQSKGTKHSIDLAIKAGKPVDIYVRK